MTYINFEDLLSNLPPPPKESILDKIQDRILSSHKKIVVLDDDPTGTQTVFGVEVLTTWSVSDLKRAFSTLSTVFFILTNSRSMDLSSAEKINQEIGQNLKMTGEDFVVVSRSDSTLRGHFPGELIALTIGLGDKFDGILLVPYFGEGERFTIDDDHYVVKQNLAVPVAETEFAFDPFFGYSQSNLRNWVEEKSDGRITSHQVQSISIADIRKGKTLEKLMKLHDSQICVVNMVCDLDLELFVFHLIEAECLGKKFLTRTAASFVRVRSGIVNRPLLTSEELHSNQDNGGLVVAGSYVPKTTRQLLKLKDRFSFITVDVNVTDVLGNNQERIIDVAQHRINQALSQGNDVILFTSRDPIFEKGDKNSMEIGQKVSNCLVEIVKKIKHRPRFIVAKGGITASDIATLALGVKKATVLGQALPGVPVWLLGPETKFPSMKLVVFPGNVGDDDALVTLYQKLSRRRQQANLLHPRDNSNDA